MPSMRASVRCPPGPDAEVDAAAGEVVEQHDAVGHHQGVVVGEAHDPGPQPDVPGALGRHGQEDLGGGDRLPAGAVVLARPRPRRSRARRAARSARDRAPARAWGSRRARGRGPGRRRSACAPPSLFGARRAPGHTPPVRLATPLAAAGLLALGAATAIGAPAARGARLPGAAGLERLEQAGGRASACSRARTA